jgi:hypothetical protein
VSLKDLGDGAIAGVLTGIVVTLISFLLQGLGIAPTMVISRISYSGGIASSLTILIFMGVIGLAIGALFGILYARIPADESIPKAIAYMLLIWVILGLLLPFIIRTGAGIPMTVTITDIMGSLIISIIWGTILGQMFTWVAGKPVVQPEETA